jgi:hypothetical protein
VTWLSSTRHTAVKPGGDSPSSPRITTRLCTCSPHQVARISLLERNTSRVAGLMLSGCQGSYLSYARQAHRLPHGLQDHLPALPRIDVEPCIIKTNMSPAK